MNKKQLARVAKIILLIVFILFILFHIRKILVSGKQIIEITSSEEYYGGSSLEASICVKDIDTLDALNSKLTVSLLDSNGKKIKNVVTKAETKDNQTANVELTLPENLEKGKYTLKVNAKSSKGNDTVEKTISIVSKKQKNVTIQLDKGIYKPGDDINYRILLTSKNNDTPSTEEIEVSIYDGNDNRVYINKVTTSEYGITSGKFSLANEVNSGTYKIKVSTSNQEFSKLFTVNPYVTPQFEAKITTDKENYLVNDKIAIAVNTKYFFGEPVKNAKVILNINDTKQEGLTNGEGTFTYEYTAKEKKTLNISAEITDDSNYLVEATKTIYVTEDVFEIEVLPEYGKMITDIDNDIYFFTKNADGSSKKTYLTLNIENKLTRQVITDEQGVGVLHLSKTDISNLITTTSESKYSNTKTSTLKMEIQAQDMDGNSFTKTQPLEVKQNTGVLIKTDKVKYQQEDDIKLTFTSKDNIKDQTIAICKNNEIVKLITTDDEDITLNLGDIYGLIDIYVLKNNNSTYLKNSNIQNKKTIFIKPNKELNIEIQTDNSEYSPKDNMNLTIGLTDENGKTIDGALLVSVLDEAILSISDNDLSIDNVKTALSDVMLSNKLDAATMYANILDDKSESTFIAMLLKQDSTVPNITTKSFNTIEEHFSAIQRVIIGSIIFGLILLIYFCIKSRKLREIMKNVIAFIGTIVTISILCKVLNEYIYIKSGAAFIIGFVIAIILYSIVLYKYKNPIARMSAEYIILGILVPFTYLMIKYFESNAKWVILVLEIVTFPLALMISSILRSKNIKENIMRKIQSISVEIIKSIGIIMLTILSGYVGVIFACIVFILLNIIYEMKFNKEAYLIKSKLTHKNKKLKRTIEVGISVGVVIGIIIISLMIMIYHNVRGTVNNASLEGNKYTSKADLSIASEFSNDDSIDINSIFEQADTFLSSSKNDENDEKDEKEEIGEIEKITQEQDETIDNSEENIRSVFLESLCFIPELITEQGKATTDLTLSDNITSWKIQVVGNTKNGNIGYGSSNITVKKDFFANFSLPTNCIVGDEVEIPVTIYNYTQDKLNTTIEITKADWFELGNFDTQITVDAASTKMVYVPITILTAGDNTLKVKATANNIEDILQKTLTVKNQGLEVTKVISSGTFEKSMTQDIIYNAQAIEGTKDLKIKLYPSTISQVVEGLENIFRMPTGCFEQTSSSLYPDIMVLKYMKENNMINSSLKEKALSYISSGYQRLLTFEVPGKKGGYSLYGKSPASPVLTAYGLMEITDLSTVYEVDENVINNMKNYLYSKQSSNGGFEIGSSHSNVVQKNDKLTLNAYIIWALSEADASDSRLNKSMKYLENNLDKLEDTYTIALAANAFTNVKDTQTANTLIERLLKQIQRNDNLSYLPSNITDYYGTKGKIQNLQATALTSIALSKTDTNTKTNANLINYIISCKDSYGTWSNTQATILSLKALVEFQSKADITNQTVTVNLNGETKSINITDNALDIYDLTFHQLGTENTLSVNMEKGQIYYEIIENYYQEADMVKENSKNEIEITSNINNKCSVNDIITQNITIKNISEDLIQNGMIEITIPQGCTVQEESLSKMITNKVIERYEYNYSKIYLYLQDFEDTESLQIDVNYRASYPGKITGGAIRVYDYYNPETEGIALPVNIEILK